MTVDARSHTSTACHVRITTAANGSTVGRMTLYHRHRHHRPRRRPRRWLRPHRIRLAPLCAMHSALRAFRHPPSSTRHGDRSGIRTLPGRAPTAIGTDGGMTGRTPSTLQLALTPTWPARSGIASSALRGIACQLTILATRPAGRIVRAGSRLRMHLAVSPLASAASASLTAAALAAHARPHTILRSARAATTLARQTPICTSCTAESPRTLCIAAPPTRCRRRRRRRRRLLEGQQ